MMYSMVLPLQVTLHVFVKGLICAVWSSHLCLCMCDWRFDWTLDSLMNCAVFLLF